MIDNLHIQFAFARAVIISDFEAGFIFLLVELLVRYFNLLIFSQRFVSAHILSSMKLSRAVASILLCILRHSLTRCLYSSIWKCAALYGMAVKHCEHCLSRFFSVQVRACLGSDVAACSCAPLISSYFQFHLTSSITQELISRTLAEYWEFVLCHWLLLVPSPSSYLHFLCLIYSQIVNGLWISWVNSMNFSTYPTF